MKIETRCWSDREYTVTPLTKADVGAHRHLLSTREQIVLEQRILRDPPLPFHRIAPHVPRKDGTLGVSVGMAQLINLRACAKITRAKRFPASWRPHRDMKMRDLDLSKRALNAIRQRAALNLTAEQFAKRFTREMILDCRQTGPKLTDEIAAMLARCGLELR